MKKLTGNQVRRMFLDFFASKGHSIEPSASLVPVNDPTLLWINSGVAAIKKYFDGSETPANPRIVNAQKSLRTNDIENVGITARHHTFFEMLGNFSIGDYFKKEAIEYAWEFLTDSKWLALDKDKLYITVHDQDEEAYNHWVNVIGIDPSHMCKTPGNFWEIGEGPCGPDSEIFYDRGPKYDPESIGTRLFHEELENDRYTEIWNLVFSQYNSQPGVDRKDYKELPQRNIDTGMGFERIVSIIQECDTNYETDLFMPMINEVEKISNCKYEDNPMAFKVIADHIRTVTFALADGALFSNEGRGYVLRRILRRAVRYGKKLGIEKSFMYQLVQVVSDIMSDYYDYLPEKVEYVSKLVRIEEEKFHQTLADGEKILIQVINNTKDQVISGEEAFKLYDTYGFPYELTVEIAAEYDKEVDEDGFKQAMEEQRTRARNSREAGESLKSQKIDLMEFYLPSTFDYNPTSITAKVIGCFVDGVKSDVISKNGEIILDKTIFYAESGGQACDTGIVHNNDFIGKVVSVIKAPNKQHLHSIEVNKGNLKVGDEVVLEIDFKKRVLTQNNHTATHLLQKALKDVLGSHINQAGSYVDENRLRFDFTHFEKITSEQIDRIEELVNEKIFEGLDVSIENMSIEKAKTAGAMALFSEKYGDIVRVVTVGDYSMELCGGCHVSNSSNIGLFKIEVEESIGSGIRRIEAVTGKQAYNSLKSNESTIKSICSTLRIPNINEVESKVEAFASEMTDLKKSIEKLNGKILDFETKELLQDKEIINGVNFLYVNIADSDNDSAKSLVFTCKDHLGSGIVVLVNQEVNKVSYFVGVTSDLVAKGYNAGKFIKQINEVTAGRGGGKPDIAQGGTTEISLIQDAIDTIKKAI